MLSRVDQIETLLIARGIEATAIKRARAISDSSRVHLLRVLNQMGELPDRAFADILADLTGVPVADTDLLPASVVETPLAVPFMRSRQILPLRADQETVDLAFVNTLDQDALAGARFALGSRMGQSFIILADDWKQAFARLYDSEIRLDGIAGSVEDQVLLKIFDQDRDAPVARRIAGLLADAAARGASDIHIEARRNHVNVRFRIDGRLEVVSQEPAEAAAALIARIKVLADLDLGERRRPQDGRTTIVIGGRPIDVRVSIVPAAEGESAVLRLLDRPSSLMTVEGLGFSSAHSTRLRRIMQSKDGLFLVAGPTGSGKTTTLYACLQMLNGSQCKIVSVEDPIEYHFEHVTQVQANETAGVDFATALRSFLRHDPDVILVGEIRDRETAQIAVQSALTGHLVVASIHAIDSERIVARLIDMGVDRYQLDAALRSALSQRLIRALCQACAEPVTPTDTAIAAFQRASVTVPDELMSPVGCSSCGGSGFRGRLVLAEFKGENEGGMLRDGLAKVALGQTTIGEVLLAVDG
jgi:general secretion pathway protein E